MGKRIICFMLLVSLLFSTFPVFGGFAASPETTHEISTSVLQQRNQGYGSLGDPTLEITSPIAGYFYLFKLPPIPLRLMNAFGLQSAMVIGRNLNIETNSVDIHHAKFIATGKFTGWQTVQWDYRTVDGLGMDFGLDLNSGIYDITVIGYTEQGQEVGSDSIKVFFLKVGRDDFGVWVNTQYDGGEMISTPLSLGLSDFGSMLNTGESRQFTVPLQNQDDTTVKLQFMRTKILDGTEKVMQTTCAVQTLCDTSKEYDVAVAVRFPFVMLDGGEPSPSENPYFSTAVGYHSYSTGETGPNTVNFSFFVGRESINDPRVFRFAMIPQDIGSGSQLTFYSQYRAIDSAGAEVFQRTFSVEFTPATELTITSIPREAKIQYDFGRSAGVPTKIAFHAEGGILDDIIQSFSIDPLPSYMAFDLTILGSREFLYESDESYDVTYALESEQDGNLVTFEVNDLPTRIQATWGMNLGQLGDLSADSFAELNMSSDVSRLALYFFGKDIPFIQLENFPRKFRIENAVDLRRGTGSITILRGLDEVRQIDLTVSFDEMVVTKTFELKNNFMQLAWAIDLVNGTGFFEISRDSESTMAFSSTIQYHDWIFSKTLELQNNHLQLSWNIDRVERTGQILFSRDAVGGDPTISFSIAHDTLLLQDTLELKNNEIELYWDLATPANPHAEIGLNTAGEELFYNTLSLIDDGVALLQFGIGVSTQDHFSLSWDYVSGHIQNFAWSGRLLQLSSVDIAINLQGDVFTIATDINIGEAGYVEMQFNKDVSVTFVDTVSERFKINGDVSFFANRRLKISWELGESGEFTIYTFGQPLGQEFNLEFGYDPSRTGNYQFGFKLTGQSFIDITRTIKWYSEQGQLMRIWILGDLPLPGDWTLQVLWNYQWYSVPWP